MREIEFEFDESGAGEFRPSGNVVRTITDYLAKGEIDRAASMLAASAAAIGDKLIEDARVGASKELWTRLANLFAKARDVTRAAACAVEIGDHALAADFYEASYEWTKAAAEHKLAGNLVKAAQMLERDLAYDKAAALYMEAGEHLQAAACFSRAGAHYHAGHMYMKVGRYDLAVESLQRVERMQRYFVESSALLGQFFERAGNTRAAMVKYSEVVADRPIDETTLEVHHRLALLMEQSGHPDRAQKLLNGVLTLSPGHQGAGQAMRRLTSVPEAPAAATAPETPAPVNDVQPPASQDPLILPGDEKAPSPEKEPMVQVHADFDVLRKLPIFSSLTLDELRGIHALSARRSFPKDSLLIEEGKPGEALMVIVSGQVRVVLAGRDGAPMEVARLGPGASIGEMAMVDSAPASASVVAAEPSSVFSFPLAKMEAHLDREPRAGLKVMRVLGRILSTRLREANRNLSER